MSERGPTRYEHDAEKTEVEQHIDISKEVESHLRKLESEKKSQDIESTESAEELLEKVEKEALSTEELRDNPENNSAGIESKPDEHLHYADLKKNTYRKRLKTTQAQLSSSERQFSKFVHHPSVEAISEIASKTIARPTGIAYGGVVACIGISLSLFFAYRYGFSYNYLLFLVFFAGGYIVSTVFELVINRIKRNKQKDIYL